MLIILDVFTIGTRTVKKCYLVTYTAIGGEGLLKESEVMNIIHDESLNSEGVDKIIEDKLSDRFCNPKVILKNELE